MHAGPSQITPDGLAFLSERHLATVTTLRADGTPHVTAAGFSWDPATAVARVISSNTSQKARNATRGVAAAICQVDGPRWITLEGVALVNEDPAAIEDAVRRYLARYREPRVNPARIAIEIQVTRVLGSRTMLDR